MVKGTLLRGFQTSCKQSLRAYKVIVDVITTTYRHVVLYNNFISKKHAPPKKCVIGKANKGP